ncbi:hypothetical protein WJX84_003405 [Apatococcus fuscideae]|uniref:Uncharacterized protein n=1 Tax=Apatococcus fuscideae TaxID=2026836 RepID=A0AAW1T204_9CHLO
MQAYEQHDDEMCWQLGAANYDKYEDRFKKRGKALKAPPLLLYNDLKVFDLMDSYLCSMADSKPSKTRALDINPADIPLELLDNAEGPALEPVMPAGVVVSEYDNKNAKPKMLKADANGKQSDQEDDEDTEEAARARLFEQHGGKEVKRQAKPWGGANTSQKSSAYAQMLEAQEEAWATNNEQFEYFKAAMDEGSQARARLETFLENSEARAVASSKRMEDMMERMLGATSS